MQQTMDEFNIYEDLDDFIETAQKPTAEVAELSKKLRNVTEELTAAHTKYEHLVNLNKTLKYNISTILLTARRELTRKDERINSLVKEKDAIIFRRGGHIRKPEHILVNKSECYERGTQTLNNKETCDPFIQSKGKSDKTLNIIPVQKHNKCTQTEKNEIPSTERLTNTKMYHQASQTDLSNKYFQTVRYVGQHNTAVKTEVVEVHEFVEKQHQSVQTTKNTESFESNGSSNNAKSEVDDSDVIESLLALSRGCPNTDIPQKLLNEDYEKLLLDRQSILDELSKEDMTSPRKPVKNPGKPLKKTDKKKYSRPNVQLNANLDIYELSPIHHMDKSKPIRQYAGGRGKQSLTRLQDCHEPDSNNTRNEMEIDLEVDSQQIEQVQKIEADVKPTLPHVDKIKKVEAENIKHPRKQKFTDIKTNCNLEHIPMDPIESKSKKVYVSKSKSIIPRSRKRRLDSLFNESVEETETKRCLRSNSQTHVAETVEKIIESKLELPPTSNTTDDQIILSLPQPKPSPPVELPFLPPNRIDNQIKSICAHPEAQALAPPPVELLSLPPNNTENQVKLIRSYPEPPIPPPLTVELPPLPPSPPNNNIENEKKETLILNETIGLQEGEEQDNRDTTFNSSVEFKMSTTSYKIETHGDETTVYIRRNKKKKKHL